MHIFSGSTSKKLHALALASFAAGLFAAARPARAEVIELIDKTKMNAKIVHYYDGVYTVETQGNTVKLPKDKIKSITFQLPAPRAEFSTPEKTFDRWRKALSDGDLEKAIDCYALMYQGMLASHLGQASDGIRLGSPATTSRGMEVAEMQQIASWIDRVIANPTDENAAKVFAEVRELTAKFPAPGISR